MQRAYLRAPFERAVRRTTARPAPLPPHVTPPLMFLRAGSPRHSAGGYPPGSATTTRMTPPRPPPPRPRLLLTADLQAIVQLLEYRVSFVVGRRKSSSSVLQLLVLQQFYSSRVSRILGRARRAAQEPFRRGRGFPCRQTTRTSAVYFRDNTSMETCRNMPKHAGVFVIVRTLLRKHTASVETFRNIPVCFHNNNFIETCS